MTNTKLINYICDELRRQRFKWKGERELFNLLIPQEKWEKYKTNWSNWRCNYTHSLTKSPHIKLAIQQTLDFGSDIWNADDITQKQAVKQGVKTFKQKREHKPIIDLSILMPTDSPITSEQKKFLEMLSTLSYKEVEHEIELYPSLFSQVYTNELFLLELLQSWYNRGWYNLLYEYIFPALLPHKRESTEIKIMEAHTLGSLTKPKYYASAKLLESIHNHSNDLQLIDLKTSATSNLRRHHLSNPNISQEKLKEILTLLIHFYHEIHKTDKQHHYYPAINLAYMLLLAEHIFPHDQELHITTTQQLHRESKPSIKKDASSNNSDTIYYAKISELEFKLLLNYPNISREFGFMLESLTPSSALIERTYRQMIFFMERIERFTDTPHPLTKDFSKVVGILKDYVAEQNL